MFVSGGRVLVGHLTVLVCRSRVLLGVVVFTHGVMVGRLMMVMRGSMVVGRCLLVVVTCRVLWCLCHLAGVPS
jgi:hypothetical protein